MMFLPACMLVIAVGICCFVDAEFAWRLYELDSQLIGRKIRQPKHWRDYVYGMGTLLIILGTLGVMSAL